MTIQTYERILVGMSSLSLHPSGHHTSMWPNPYFTAFPFVYGTLFSRQERLMTNNLWLAGMYCSLWTASLDNLSLRLRLASECLLSPHSYELSPVARLRLSIRFEQIAGKGVYHNRSLTGLQKGMFLSNNTGATRCSDPLHCGYIISPHCGPTKNRTWI